MPESDSQVVLITGTRRGIGRHLAEHFAGRGARVVGCSREPIDWQLDGYTHVVADVSQESDVKTLMSQVQREFGRLDVAINNAGIASMNAALLTPTATVDRIMATNFRGTVLVCREAAKLMLRRKYGRIVNLSTIAVPMRLEGEAAYAASKSAVVTYSQILARELGPLGITVNVVGPTPIETDLIRHVPKDKIQRILDHQAIKRLGQFEDVANVIDFFVKPESEYVTGQVIYLGGV
jgi:3-oxoacyl-[acyl-carrier protein] reductase